MLVALRWIAVLIGLPYAVQSAATGELPIVGTVAVAIFITSLRTMFPLKIGDPRARSVAAALADVAILSAGVGLTSGFANPLVGNPVHRGRDRVLRLGPTGRTGRRGPDRGDHPDWSTVRHRARASRPPPR